MKSYVLLLLVAIALCTGCSPSKKVFNNTADWLPPDFDPKEDFVLIHKVTWPIRQQKKIEEYMTKNYTYQYAFIPGDLPLASQYTDTSKYRYVIIGTHETRTKQSMDFSRPPITIEMFDFYFYDRVTQKKYPPTRRGSSYSSMTFIAMINTILKK